MSDIFSEVDEEVRREQLKRVWERYGIYIVALAILFVAAVGGWRAYEWYEMKKATEAGNEFEAAIVLSQEGKTQEAEAAFSKIAKDGTTSYRMLSKLREAGELAKRDPKAAVPIYDALASDRSMGTVMQDLATLRAGYIVVDTETYEEVRKRLEPLTGQDRVFRHSARSLLALSAWKAKDAAAVRRWSDIILTDGETPSGTRTQIEMLQALSPPEAKG